MAISVSCAECGAESQASAEMAGRKGKCPCCGGVLFVPTPDSDGDLGESPIEEEAIAVTMTHSSETNYIWGFRNFGPFSSDQEMDRAIFSEDEWTEVDSLFEEVSPLITQLLYRYGFSKVATPGVNLGLTGRSGDQFAGHIYVYMEPFETINVDVNLGDNEVVTTTNYALFSNKHFSARVDKLQSDAKELLVNGNVREALILILHRLYECLDLLIFERRVHEEDAL